MMTDAERSLLLYAARWITEHLDEQAAELGTTNNLADEMRKLIEKIRPGNKTEP